MTKTEKKPHLVLIMIVYLAGIFMGALDTGIVTPARTLIQNDLNVNAQTGIWMITIYTLAYAVSIPIMGKLADRYGRKYVYLTSILLFGIGSLFCGLSQLSGSFTILIISRAVQAIGGGGIIPIANAEFGTSFPKEKRGMALGLIGGVYGIANIFGASAGSAILDIFGKNNWQFIFYVNVPITLFIVVAGLALIKNTTVKSNDKIDIFGIMTLTAMILSLLYGLRNLDFFDIRGTIGNTDVYPFLLVFILLLPLFIIIEKKAHDPVMNLKYFTNRNIVITLILSFISGIVMMGMIFVPQFSENNLNMASGSGGYLVIILGLFAGVGAPLSGKLIDKWGAKPILAIGFGFSIIGCLFLIFVTTAYPSFITVLICLVLIGLGIGFFMGTPLNYMMLSNTIQKESNYALATLSLIRSVGTAIAPAIMVGFIAHAGLNVQSAITDLLPKEIKVPSLVYSQDITNEINKLKSDPNLKERLSSVKIPDLTTQKTIKINMNGSGKTLPDDIVELMQKSDVTTITANTKTLASRMFKLETPTVTADIQKGIASGIDGIKTGLTQLSTAQEKLQSGYDGLGKGIDGMKQGLAAQKNAITQLKSAQSMLLMQHITAFPPNMSLADFLPPQVKKSIPAQVLTQLSAVKSPQQLAAQIAVLQTAITAMEAKITQSETGRAQMLDAISKMKATQTEMKELVNKMTLMKDSVPSAFESVLTGYLKTIDNLSEKIDDAFRSTLNSGFKNVYLTSLISALLALLTLMFYSRKQELEVETKTEKVIKHKEPLTEE